MIVDQLNTSLRGGAAVAAMRLHEGLLKAGVTSRLWCKPTRHAQPESQRAGVSTLSFPGSTGVSSILRLLKYRYFKRQLRGRPTQFEVFSIPWGKRASNYTESPLQGDILHLHWVNSWLDWPSFFGSLPPSLPIVWTLHDMNPITGGCHHHDGCEEFHTGCGNCPQLKFAGHSDVSRLVFEAKQVAYQGKNLHIVTPSRWLQRHAEMSGLTAGAASIRTIYNSLNVQEFSPVARTEARQALGLPLDKTILSFGAASLDNRRKGLREFSAAVSQLKNVSEILCLGIGAGDTADYRNELPDFRITGYLTKPRDLALVYSASDVFVLPSLGENMPQMAVEAMACGTPVAAFDVGGVSEIVIPDKTGALAPCGDCQALAAGIQSLIDDPHRRSTLGRQARQLVVREFDLETQTQKYLDLYHEISSGVSQPRKCA